MRRLALVLLLPVAACTAQPTYVPAPAPVSTNAVSTPDRYANQTMVLDKEVQPLSRNEIIMAVQECEDSGLRAVMVIAKRKINGFTTDIVADVTCAPKFRH